MKQISLRDFSLHPTKYIKELPIILTRYNLPVASVIPHVGTFTDRSVDSTNSTQTSVNTSATISLENSKWPTHYLGRPLSGKKSSCPVCHESIPVEFAQQHYSKRHEDI